jgi:hypothetical protein
LVIEDTEEEAYMVILNEEGDEDALIYLWSESDEEGVPDEQPSNQEPFVPDDAPSSSRFVPDDAPSSAHLDTEADDESFVPEDHRDYSTAPRLPMPPGPHAFISLSDRMGGQYAVNHAEDPHEEAVAAWPHTYDTYLRHYAQWYHEHPRPSRSDELDVTRDDDESELFRAFLTDVVALLPVKEVDRQAWVYNVLLKLHEISIYTIRECLQDIMMINQHIIRIDQSPLFHRTLNMFAQRAVEALVPEFPPIGNPGPPSSSSDKAYHVHLTNEERTPSATVKKATPKCVLRLQLTKEA